LPDRLVAVLTVVYLIFNEGYGGRGELAAEAIRLGETPAGLMPDEPETSMDIRTCTRPEPSSCAASAGTGRPEQPTNAPWSWLATNPTAASSSDDWQKYRRRRASKHSLQTPSGLQATETRLHLIPSVRKIRLLRFAAQSSRK
jgi:hypothetical protein